MGDLVKLNCTSSVNISQLNLAFYEFFLTSKPR